MEECSSAVLNGVHVSADRDGAFRPRFPVQGVKPAVPRMELQGGAAIQKVQQGLYCLLFLTRPLRNLVKSATQGNDLIQQHFYRLFFSLIFVVFMIA